MNEVVIVQDAKENVTIIHQIDANDKRKTFEKRNSFRTIHYKKAKSQLEIALKCLESYGKFHLILCSNDTSNNYTSVLIGVNIHIKIINKVHRNQS